MKGRKLYVHTVIDSLELKQNKQKYTRLESIYLFVFDSYHQVIKRLLGQIRLVDFF